MIRRLRSSPTPSQSVRRPLSLAGFTALALILVLSFAPGGAISAFAAAFSNTNAVTIADNTTATPYPSTINVAGITGNITSVKVILKGLSHSFPADIDMLLVGPTGKAIVLMSDAGSSIPITSIDLTFSDAAANYLPLGPISAGEYKPTNYGASDTFPTPAPAGPYDAALSTFTGTNPNGTWSLYIVDDTGGSAGQIAGGWSLDIATADLAVTMSAPASVNAGDSNLTYAINVVNNGPDAADKAKLTDSLPANTTFVSLTKPAGWTCTTPAVGSAGTISCDNPSFGVTSAAFSLVVKVNPATAASTTLGNTASVSATTPETNTANNTATASTTVTTSADLRMAITAAPNPVTAGTNLTYTVGLTNAGPSNAQAAKWTETLPTGTTFVSLTKPAGWTCTTPAVGSAGAISCTNAVLGLTSASFTLVLKVNASVPDAATLSNTVTASSTTTDPAAANDSASANVTVAARADLGIAIADTPDPVNAGANLTYNITVSNAGPSNAANAKLTDTLPANTTFVSLATPVGWTCTNPSAGSAGTVTCTNPSLAPGNTSFSLVVKVAPTVAKGAVLTNTPAITSDTTDAVAGNNSKSTTTTVNTQANLAVTLTDTPDPVTAGTNMTYTLTLSNAGPSNAATSTLSDTLPSNVTFVSLVKPASWTCTTPAVGATGKLSCSNPSFGLTSDVFTLVVKVKPTTPVNTVLSNTAQIAAATSDPVAANNSATTTTKVTTAVDLSVTVTDSPDPVTAGSQLTYSIVVKNAGPSNAAAAKLTNNVPANTTFSSLSAPTGWTCTTPKAGETGTVSCSNPSFGLTTATFTLVVKVNPTTAGGTSISDSAAIASTTTDTNPANQSASTTTAVVTSANLGLTVVDTPDPVSAAAKLTYRITLVNRGPSNAAGAKLDSAVPTNTTFEALAKPAGWTCSNPAAGGVGAVSCSNTSFGVGTAIFTMTVQVKSGTAVNTVLSQAFAATSTTTDPDTTDNSTTVTTTVTTVADLSLTVGATPSPVPAGADLTYRVRVNNSGPEQARDVKLTASVPAGTTFRSITVPAGWMCTTPAVGSAGAVTCTNLGLDATTDEIMLVVRVDPKSTATNISDTFKVTSSTTDSNATNNSVTVTTPRRSMVYFPWARA